MTVPNIPSSKGQRPRRKVHSPLPCIAILGLTFLFSCRKGPEIAEYPPFIYTPAAYNIDRVPVILVGRVLSSSDVEKPRPSKWNRQAQTKLSEVTVAVENVLQGSVNRHEISIYYFVIASPYDGYRLLDDWKPGERDIFFLQEDSGVLRNICDNYKGCVISVFTGAHPNWKRDPKRYITDDILTLLLSRGVDCGDAALLEAMDHAGRYSFIDPQERDVIAAVERVAIHETPVVRHGACQILAHLGDDYSKHMAGDPVQASLRSACGATLKEQ